MFRKFWWLFFLFLFCNPLGATSLEWDANTEPGLAGYKVYRGESPGVYSWSQDVGNVTTFPIVSLDPTKDFYFAVTAYSPTKESGFSNEVVRYAQLPGIAPATNINVSYVEVIPMALDFQETFDGNQYCTGSSGAQNCLNTTWITDIGSPNYAGTGLQGTYALVLAGTETAASTYFTPRSVVYVTWMMKVNTNNFTDGGGFLNFFNQPPAFPPPFQFKSTGGNADSFYVLAYGGTAGSLIHCTVGTTYYFKVKLTANTGGSSTKIECWVSSDGINWGSVASQSTDGNISGNAGDFSVYFYTGGSGSVTFDDIRTSANDISYGGGLSIPVIMHTYSLTRSNN